MRISDSSSKQGLTLIEVVLAAGILSIGMTILLVAASRCIAVMKVSKQYQTAQWVMGLGEVEYPIMTENIDDIDDLEVRPDDSLFEGYTFSRSVEENDDEEDDLFIIRSRVSWSRHGKESYHEVTQYIWYPEADN